MALILVNLPTDVYFVCVNHALSTEGEEIVGLLVGEVDESRVAHISAVVILRRSDKRRDRVEISPEQLSSASSEAERLACILKRPIRVVGWYHSHPKLTVWPSTIDVNTQDSYQLMDDGFIGIIFSVFNEDPTKRGGRIQMTCFQSQTVLEDGSIEKKRLDIPVYLVPSNYISHVCMSALTQLPRFLCQEEQLAYQVTNQMQLDYLTRVHNSSVYLRSMGQIAEIICGPLIKMLEERIINNEVKRKKLQNKKKELKTILEQIYMANAPKESEAIPSVSVDNPNENAPVSMSVESASGSVEASEHVKNDEVTHKLDEASTSSVVEVEFLTQVLQPSEVIVVSSEEPVSIVECDTAGPSRPVSNADSISEAGPSHAFSQEKENINFHFESPPDSPA